MSSGENQQVEPRDASGRRQPRSDTADAKPFKTCTFCGHVWPKREDFLADPKIVEVGYQAYLPELALGLFLFNHMVCETTLALKAEDFSDLHAGPIYQQQLNGTKGCMGHCDHQKDLEACPSECECAWVREVLQVVKGWKKQTAQAS